MESVKNIPLYEIYLFVGYIIEEVRRRKQIVRCDFGVQCEVIKPASNSDEPFFVNGKRSHVILSPASTYEYLEGIFDDYIARLRDDDSDATHEGLMGSGFVITGIVDNFEFSLSSVREAEECEQLNHEEEFNPRAREKEDKKCTASKRFWEVVYRARRNLKTAGKETFRQKFTARFPDIRQDFENTDITDSEASFLIENNFGEVFSGFRWILVDKYLMPFYHKDLRNGAQGKTRILMFDATANMWRYVFDQSLLKIPQSFFYCNTCRKFHHTREKLCWGRYNVSYADEYSRFERVPADLVFYGDFESMDVVDNYHRISGLGVMSNKDDVACWSRGKDFHEDVVLGELFFTFILGLLPALNVELVEQGDELRPYRCAICDWAADRMYISDWNNCGIEGENAFCEPHWKLDAGSIPVFFHNGAKYDVAHVLSIIIPNLNAEEIADMSFIAKTANRLETINVKFPGTHLYISFRDSLKHILGSIKQLAKTIPNFTLEKGEFPYEWFISEDQLDLPDLPPPGPAWTSTLTGKTANAEEAHRLFAEKGFTTVREYHDYYMMTDVRILKEAFELHRKTMINFFGVDPARFNGTPSTSIYVCRKLMADNEELWCSMPDSLLKDEFFSDVIANIRGGITQVVKRYQNKGPGLILYADVNGMYSSCMRFGKFAIGSTVEKLEDMSLEEFIRDFVLNEDRFGRDKDEGFFAIISVEATEEAIFKYPIPPVEQKWGNGLNNTWEPVVGKMFQWNRIRQMMRMGYEIKEVLKVYTYKHAEKYNAAMTAFHEERIKAKAAGDKATDLSMKLCGNGAYGKTCERADKFKTCEFKVQFDAEEVDGDVEYADETDMLKTTSAEGESVRVSLFKAMDTTVKNQPWDGFSVLEYAREMFYEGQEAILNAGGEVLYSDTDSIISYRADKNYHRDLLRDFPNVFCPQGSKTPGMWELEEEPEEITEFIGIAPKCYYLSFASEGREGLDKHKGISNYTKIARDCYFDAVFEGKVHYEEQKRLQLTKDRIALQIQEKVAIRAKNGKRIVLNDRINTVPIGHPILMSRDDLNNLE